MATKKAQPEVAGHLANGEAHKCANGHNALEANVHEASSLGEDLT
jgi:hypothetical protein